MEGGSRGLKMTKFLKTFKGKYTRNFKGMRGFDLDIFKNNAKWDCMTSTWSDTTSDLRIT